MFRDYPVTELVYHTPFQLLMSVMLSAQTTDKQVNKVTAQFYDRIRTPQDICKMSEEELYVLIRWVNYSKTKAKHIYETAGKLSQQISPNQNCLWEWMPAVFNKRGEEHQWDYNIPDTLDELTKLPGVGVKTAKVVLYILYGQKYIAVDTHVHRVAHRLWRVTWLNPEKTSEALEKLIADDYKDIAHRVMIYFGRYLCTSQHPKCDSCPLQKQCKYYSSKK